MNTRKRTAQPPEDEQQETRSPNLKKIRTRSALSHHVSACESKDGTALNTAHTRIGLLTPETSTLGDSQQPCATDTTTTTTTTTTTEAPAPIFPFMKLPAELRIHIYHMALVREDALLLHADRALEKMEDEGTMLTAYMGARSSSSASTTAPSTTTTTTPSTAPVPPTRETLLPSHAFLHPHRPRTIGPTPIPLRDPIVPALLRLNKTVYREARQVLYSDNVFTLCLTSGIHTLSTLHQRSRSLIKHIVLTIPSHHDILDGFADLVRLGLRYCWGLKTFRIILQASLPDDGRVAGATSVYANAFHILRWLPRGCRVALEENVSEAVRRVVAEEGRLQSVLDEASYLKRQHQMPERH